MDSETEGALHLMLLPELVAIAGVFVLLTYSLLPGSTLWASYSRTLRLAGAVVLSTDLIAPLAVYIDMRLSGREVDHVWIHAAALPVVNVIGVAAYMADRDRLEGE